MYKETSAFNDVESIMTLFDEIGRAIVRQGKFSERRGSTLMM